MKVEIADVLFWMDAIRNSEDRYRTLESFWKGQVNSKIWLIENLKLHVSNSKAHRIIIHGGWNGVLASLLFNSDMNIDHITSLDLDPLCEDTARTVNKRQEIEGKFSAVTADMTSFTYDADIVINTSCEHITQEQYEKWLCNVPKNSLIILQSNNYFDIEEHIRCAVDVDDFIQMSNIKVLFSGELETQKYRRFMIIGQK